MDLDKLLTLSMVTSFLTQCCENDLCVCAHESTQVLAQPKARAGHEVSLVRSGHKAARSLSD